MVINWIKLKNKNQTDLWEDFPFCKHLELVLQVLTHIVCIIEVLKQSAIPGPIESGCLSGTVGTKCLCDTYRTLTKISSGLTGPLSATEVDRRKTTGFVNCMLVLSVTWPVCSMQGRLQWNLGPEAPQHWPNPECQHGVSDTAGVDAAPAGGVHAEPRRDGFSNPGNPDCHPRVPASIQRAPLELL